MENISEKQKKTQIWFKFLRNQICEMLEESEKKFHGSEKSFKKKNGIETQPEIRILAEVRCHF